MLLVLLLAAAPQSGGALFDDTKLHTIHILLENEKAYAQLDELPLRWVDADVEVDGTRLAGVRVRRKGVTTTTLGTPKTSLRIKLSKKKRYHGLKNLVLNNERYDPTMMREKLAYEIYAKAGCIVPRAVHAEVFMSVAGKRSLLGLYTLVEHVGDPFLDDHFGGHRGSLYKVTGAADIFAPDFPEPLADLQTSPRTKKIDRDRLHRALRGELPLENVAPCLAAEIAVVNLDGYAAGGHNFYLYDDPLTGNFYFIPWDLDQSLGQAISAKKEDLIAWAVAQPRTLFTRIRYAQHLRAIAGGPLSPREFTRRVRALRTSIAPAVERDPNKPFDTFARSLVEDVDQRGGRDLFRLTFGLEPFARARSASIFAQLAGLEPGVILQTR